MFEKLAGVRGDVANAIAPPRGLPSDVSEAVAVVYESEQVDWHSESFITASEMPAFYKWRQEYRADHRWVIYEWGFIMGNGWETFDEHPEMFPGIEDVRLVFWFDS